MKWKRNHQSAEQVPRTVGVAAMTQNRLRDKYLSIERDIHFDKSETVLDAYWKTWESNARYEDGLATYKNDTFRNSENFVVAYEAAVRQATSRGLDPHIRWRAHIFESLLRSAGPGTRLELGTAHGFMFYFALTKHQLDGCLDTNASVVLVDKFTQEAVDPVSGFILRGTNAWYASDLSKVKNLFRPFPNVRIQQGVVPDVLSTLDLGPISFLHLDLNAARPEARALEELWPNLLVGAIVLFDDYGWIDFSATKDAHDHLVSRFGRSICVLPTGQGLLIK